MVKLSTFATSSALRGFEGPGVPEIVRRLGSDDDKDDDSDPMGAFYPLFLMIGLMVLGGAFRYYSLSLPDIDEGDEASQTAAAEDNDNIEIPSETAPLAASDQSSSAQVALRMSSEEEQPAVVPPPAPTDAEVTGETSEASEQAEENGEGKAAESAETSEAGATADAEQPPIPPGQTPTEATDGGELVVAADAGEAVGL